MNKIIFNGDVKITEDNQTEWEEKLDGVTNITGYLYINSNVTLKADSLKTVGGYLSINSNVTLKADSLKTVGGYLSVYSTISEDFAKRLYYYNSTNKFIVTDLCPEWLLNQRGKFTYKINDVVFKKELFDGVRKDLLSAKEVFAIENLEQRRIAYEKMDKIKMRELEGFKIFDEQTDKQGNPMKLVTFSLPGFANPFKYLNCICPSTGREYFIETQQDDCWKAKAQSFGEDTIEFGEEY